jgi:hypothetical protein
MSTPPIPAVQQEFKPLSGFQPTTFMERGVAVPFTTPLLAGARARPGERSSLELVVSNPSGGRGVYILAWADIANVCQPTVHDRRLTEAVAALRSVTPDAIRHAAREVAASGMAGRGALAAAVLASESEEKALLQTNFDLLLEVVRQIEPKGEHRLPPQQDRPAELERRARSAVARIAPILRYSPEAVATSLERLASIFANIGVGRSARIPAAIARLIQLRSEVATFAEANPDDYGAEAGLIGRVADLTITLAKATLADAKALPGDVVALLRRWLADPDGLAKQLARPEWLLDGWDRICALWETAPATGSTIAEMAALLPVLPIEANDWLSRGADIVSELPRSRRKVVRELEDWRTGLVACDLIARNETLLEMTM